MTEADDVPRRRKVSTATIARRAEGQLLAPHRSRIADLQRQVALIAATAISSKAPPRAETDRRYEEIRTAISEELIAIDMKMEGQPSLGPAADCRKALAMLASRLFPASANPERAGQATEPLLTVAWRAGLPLVHQIEPGYAVWTFSTDDRAAQDLEFAHWCGWFGFSEKDKPERVEVNRWWIRSRLE